jgi:hypothetical protein
MQLPRLYVFPPLQKPTFLGIQRRVSVVWCTTVFPFPLMQRDIQNLHSPLPPSLQRELFQSSDSVRRFATPPVFVSRAQLETDMRLAVSYDRPYRSPHAHPRDRSSGADGLAYSENQSWQISNVEPRMISSISIRSLTLRIASHKSFPW